MFTVLPWVLAAIVLMLVGRQAAALDWVAIGSAMASIPASTLLVAAVGAALSHLAVSSFDLVGRRQSGHTLPVQRTLCNAAISYAFNLNFGALVGGMAMRLRLYTRMGLRASTVAQIIGLSMLTNWLGYALVTGALLVLAPPPWPPAWPIGDTSVRFVGAALMATGVAYLLLCAFSRRRQWQWRGHRVRLPGARMALWQAAVASANWLLMGGIVFVLLQGQVAFVPLTVTLLLAAVAGVITHVPAGIGVLEAVFVVMLQGRVAEVQLLAALLAYRAVYYLLPLLWAIPGYAVTETRRANRTGIPGPAAAAPVVPRR